MVRCQWISKFRLSEKSSLVFWIRGLLSLGPSPVSSHDRPLSPNLQNQNPSLGSPGHPDYIPPVFADANTVRHSAQTFRKKSILPSCIVA